MYTARQPISPQWQKKLSLQSWFKTQQGEIRRDYKIIKLGKLTLDKQNGFTVIALEWIISFWARRSSFTKKKSFSLERGRRGKTWNKIFLMFRSWEVDVTAWAIMPRTLWLFLSLHRSYMFLLIPVISSERRGSKRSCNHSAEIVRSTAF